MSTTIHIRQDFEVPAQKVFAFFSNHSRLGEIWNGRFQRIKDSLDPDNINGEGSVRLVSLPFISFEESITKMIPSSQIEYTITKGNLLKSHYGVMRFIEMENDKSRMDYQIEIDSGIAFANGFLKVILQAALGRGVRKLAKKFIENPEY